jgi:hypothetical protein
VGTLREDILEEMFIWRLILAGKVTLEGVNLGNVDLLQLVKLNDLMNWEAACQPRTGD